MTGACETSGPDWPLPETQNRGSRLAGEGVGPHDSASSARMHSPESLLPQVLRPMRTSVSHAPL